jgi:ATP-binding cassette subfamily B protein
VSLTVRYFGAAIHRRFDRIQEQLSDVSSVTQESLAGIRVIRAYRRESSEIERFRLRQRGVPPKETAVSIRLQGIYNPSMGLLDGAWGAP